MARPPAVTLLLVHGGGFCKDAWDPIVRRLQDAPLLAGRTDFETFDFSWHGSQRDESVAAQVDRSNPEKPRVSHPAQDIVTWAPQEVWRQVQRIRAEQRARGQSGTTPLIGIGHSMGAMSLWKTEVMHPGTFSGLILFEPGYGIRVPENDFAVNYLVSITLQREAKWYAFCSRCLKNMFMLTSGSIVDRPNRAAAEEHFYNLRNFARWDREALAGYLRGGLIEESDSSISLACHPLIEASLYCHTPLYLSDEMLQRPRCRIYFQGGGRSKVYNHRAFEDMATRYPEIYRTRRLIPNLSHAMVMEGPALCTDKILKDLGTLVPAEGEPLHSRI
ncbi:hypothetical protein BBJ28_00020941 [Nothophytophthora sp. Chile5]|nr:hypothetical protein BBJ28_00020941 [Nothophytophthora sp. Chile5]